MKTVILNSFDARGGAAIATYRLHQALRGIGVDSQMLVQEKSGGDATVYVPAGRWQQAASMARPYIDHLPLRFYPQRERVPFSAAWLPDSVAARVAALQPELVHLFWINAGFMRLETLRALHKPIVWTLHDMWPFTGGCHYDDECGRYRQGCGACPVLHSMQPRDLSSRILARKQRAWQGLPLTVVATSRWLADAARQSTLFRDLRIEVLPNAVEHGKYQPLDKRVARQAFGLPQDKRLLLFSAFGATRDRRKGFHLLLPALQQLAAEGWGDRMELVVLGAAAPERAVDFGIKAHFISRLDDEISQVLLYSATDVLVAPSTQENLSNTVMESLACGLPNVAFDIGGMPDMISHRHSGYLARAFEPADLAAGIAWVIGDTERQAMLATNARAFAVASYNMPHVAAQYEALYRDILS